MKSDHESNFKIKVAFILVLNDFDGKMFLDVNIFQGIDNNFPFLIRQKSNWSKCPKKAKTSKNDQITLETTIITKISLESAKSVCILPKKKSMLMSFNFCLEMHLLKMENDNECP